LEERVPGFKDSRVQVTENDFVRVKLILVSFLSFFFDFFNNMFLIRGRLNGSGPYLYFLAFKAFSLESLDP
jgi:hypothetical protein